jgi:alkylation response protein AidB-like acyl-CoA dehydrogenase
MLQLTATELTDKELGLQADVCQWLETRLPEGSFEPCLGIAARTDVKFSRDLAQQGWVGMTLPPAYGGHGRSAVERLIVVEELLAVGAPIGYHWVADRQSGPNIAANGTEEQKAFYLPKIANAEVCFGIGMSEPDSGSDLASLRTRAIPQGDGWRVTGTKVWTTQGGAADYLLALFRTSDDRRGGLTQFIVDLKSEGVTVSPIEFIDGSDDFYEIAFDDVYIPDSQRLGAVSGGWSQNVAELALERGGVDRWMSFIPVLEHWSRGEWGSTSEWGKTELGFIAARCWAYRSMSLSVARMVDAGLSPSTEAAVIKDMGTRFEQDCVELLVRHFGRTPNLGSDDPYESLLARALLTFPSWTIRGGTTEILRNIISKAVQRP